MIDTHCHIHDSEFYPETREQVYEESRARGVRMVCVGTDVRSSREAVAFVRSHPGCYAVVGIHPHEAANADVGEIRTIIEQNKDVIVGVGEIGLDYYYTHSPKPAQADVLRRQLALAQEFSLPVSFHVRDAFDDFWHIYDEYTGVNGVLHSFTDVQANADEGYKRGLLIGINGISTFTKDELQQQFYRNVPLEKMVLETDAPFLTPKPFRGKINSPAYVYEVAAFHARERGISPEDVIAITTQNAEELFRITK